MKKTFDLREVKIEDLMPVENEVLAIEQINSLTPDVTRAVELMTQSLHELKLPEDDSDESLSEFSKLLVPFNQYKAKLDRLRIDTVKEYNKPIEKFVKHVNTLTKEFEAELRIVKDEFNELQDFAQARRGVQVTSQLITFMKDYKIINIVDIKDVIEPSWSNKTSFNKSGLTKKVIDSMKQKCETISNTLELITDDKLRQFYIETLDYKLAKEQFNEFQARLTQFEETVPSVKKSSVVIKKRENTLAIVTMSIEDYSKIKNQIRTLNIEYGGNE